MCSAFLSADASQNTRECRVHVLYCVVESVLPIRLTQYIVQYDFTQASCVFYLPRLLSRRAAPSDEHRTCWQHERLVRPNESHLQSQEWRQASRHRSCFSLTERTEWCARSIGQRRTRGARRVSGLSLDRLSIAWHTIEPSPTWCLSARGEM